MDDVPSAFATIRYVRETASTNADATALLGDPQYRGLSIVADFQTHGAGRKGRSWLAAPGSSLLCTTILPRHLLAASLWIVPYWTALCVGRALRECGIPTEIAWPNDVLIDNRKVAGVLCVSRVSGDAAWAGCGVGINIRRSAEADTIEPPAGFCDDVVPVEREALLRELLIAYDATLEQLDNPLLVARFWERQANVPGRRYRILKDGEEMPFEALALQLVNGGGLLVKRDDGAREVVSLADARALR